MSMKAFKYGMNYGQKYASCYVTNTYGGIERNQQIQKEINYSLVGVVWPNTEMLISRPFAGLFKIRLLLRDCMRTKNVRN